MRYKRPAPKKKPHRINTEIRANEVRLIDENKEQIGIIPIEKALSIAEERELDLVEISPQATPPVCRLLDYGKYLYALHKKAHAAQKQQKRVQLKEIKFTPVIGEHDIEVKLKKIREFLEDGYKVKVTIWLRGRQKRKPEMLGVMTDRILAILAEFAEIETVPKREGFSTYVLISQKKGGKDAKVKES